TSRSTISRLLAMAKAEGLIEFRLHTPNPQASELESRLRERYGIEAQVVPVVQNTTEVEVLDQVARAAAWLFSSLCESDMIIGVAWGTTVAAISKHLTRKATRRSIVVQLNGAGNTFTTGIDYASDILGRFGSALDARVQQFPVPTFFDFAETKEALWRERSIIRILQLQERADVLLFSVGAIQGGLPSHVYSGGYLEAEDLETIVRHQVVGDVATHFLRSDGSTEGIPLNARSSGPPPEVIRKAPRRLCVVSGAHKAKGLNAAISGGLITDLVVDERTASALFELPEHDEQG
ncbi:MAG: sugar-binding transcriptional regulator, partial [Acidimicrobiales bacterium]